MDSLLERQLTCGDAKISQNERRILLIWSGNDEVHIVSICGVKTLPCAG